MKQLVYQAGKLETFVVHGADRDELIASADVMIGGARDGRLVPMVWNEIAEYRPYWGALKDMPGAIARDAGKPVHFYPPRSDGYQRYATDLRCLDAVRAICAEQVDDSQKGYYLDNWFVGFRPQHYRGVEWCPPDEYAVAVYRCAQMIRELVGPDAVLLGNFLARRDWPESLVEASMSVLDMAMLETPKLWFDQPLSNYERNLTALYMDRMHRYQCAVTLTPPAALHSETWLRQVHTAMAMCEIANPDTAVGVFPASQTMAVVAPPWGDLGKPIGNMTSHGDRYSREFEGGELVVDLARGELLAPQTVRLWEAT